MLLEAAVIVSHRCNSGLAVVYWYFSPASQAAVACMEDIEDLSMQAAMEENGYAPHNAKPLVVQSNVRAECSAMAKVWVRSYGCSHNFSDSEYMAGQLQSHGYRCCSGLSAVVNVHLLCVTKCSITAAASVEGGDVAVL